MKKVTTIVVVFNLLSFFFFCLGGGVGGEGVLEMRLHLPDEKGST